MSPQLPKSMRAIRLRPSSSSTPFSATNPAPASSLVLDSDIPVPQLSSPSELLIRVHATTMVRGCLGWPESYTEPNKILGWDFSGTVVGMHADAVDSVRFKMGDRVYGMASAERAGTWAEYAVVSIKECAAIPEGLGFEEAASVPMNGLTAWQALFDHAEVVAPTSETRQQGGSSKAKKVLITGASGCVGIFLLQLAKLAELTVTAASRSNARNEEFLTQLGADEVVEYAALAGKFGQFDIIIDSVGGVVLEKCWQLAKDDGKLISIESDSFDFVQAHKKVGFGQDKPRVKALFFIVSPSQRDMERLSSALRSRSLKPFVARTVTLAETAMAYDATALASERGKVVLLP